jgi:hypothetical protein
MARHPRLYAQDVFPTDAPSVGGDVLLLDDGSALVAVKNGSALAWAMICAGSEYAQVRGAVQSPTAAATLSVDGMTLTANAPASFNAGAGHGGINTWAVGDRVLLLGQLAQEQNGVWVVFSLGGGTPWVLVRAPDARTASALPIGRAFAVQEGFNGGRTWRLAFAGLDAPVPGVDPLVFAPEDNYVGGASVSVGAGTVINLNVAHAGPVAGAVDVVVFNANCPFACTVKALRATVATPSAAGATAQVRNATGGGGTVGSGPVLIDAVGKALEGAGGGFTTDLKLAPGDSLVVRLTDGTGSMTFDVDVVPS